MEERIRFAVLAAKGDEVFSDLCARFGITVTSPARRLTTSRAVSLSGAARFTRIGEVGPQTLELWPTWPPSRDVN
jgi:hypothetical protein